MKFNEEQNDSVQVAEKVEIFSTDDEKIKAIGEVLTTDASRAILKLLFTDAMTANQIAQKTGMSLQLAKYHLKKMQDLDLVKISKIGKNTKAHDMKYYSANKFAIVIVPSKISEIARASKSLFRSFKTIYRFSAIGIAAVAAWIVTQTIQSIQEIPQVSELPQKWTDITQKTTESGTGSYNSFYNAISGPYGAEDGGGTGATLEEMMKLAKERVHDSFVNPHAGSGTPLLNTGIFGIPPNLFWPVIITICVITVGLTIELFLRIRKFEIKSS